MTFYSESNLDLYHGDCLDVLAKLPANSVDTVITDPPYHLITGKAGGTGVASLNPNSPAGRSRIGTGFMGKAWDGGDVAFRPETWAAVLRVAKPGAMLLAFGGTRTFHRLTCAIEDAGWEIRDCMSWLYGSGFPKSLDISKAIDKAVGAERVILASGKAVKRMIPGADQDCTGSWIKDNGREFVLRLTAPATADAKTWDGWGTALKPAWEPIIVAMKPLDGTFAKNAQAHGVAGLNIDGGRIEAEAGASLDGGRVGSRVTGWNRPWKNDPKAIADCLERGAANVAKAESLGRFPANVLLDEVAAGILDEQSGVLTSNSGTLTQKNGIQKNAFGKFRACASTGISDSGGASRFFYTAKASRSDRGATNDHPTVKPTELLKYLCRLTATPRGGVVLDPFAGSGTTLVAARDIGRRSIGIELEESHCCIVIERLRQGVLFAGGAA